MQAAAVGVARALRYFGVDARLKWPNDVLVGCRGKICGILAEASPKEGNTDYVVLGIGLNANLDPEDLGRLTDRPVATVRSELGRDADLLDLLDAILRHLDAALYQLTDDSFPAVMRERRTLECTLGERVSVRRSDETLTGRVVDLSPEGALVLDTGRGVVELFEGEVERLRKE
jgi:BirA family biotin operon repressor/biotin-[acetyl-CoA-carboxylase] ligase